MFLKFPRLALAATLTLALAFTFSCSDANNVPNDRIVVRKEKVSGVSQKGPFAQGAKVKIYELSRNMERIGDPYEGTTDDNGNFVIEIENGILSPYISLEVSGKYANEVRNEPSTGAITLNAVADVSEKSKVNINVFTHLEYAKVLELAKNGSFEEAKKTAQKEVLNALGMDENLARNKNSEDMSLFGGSASDSLLLVASVLLQGNRQTAEDVSSLLNDIIRDNGALSKETRAKLESGLEGVNMSDVMKHISDLAPSAKVPNIKDIDIKDIVTKIDSVASSSSVIWELTGAEGNNQIDRCAGYLECGYWFAYNDKNEKGSNGTGGCTATDFPDTSGNAETDIVSAWWFDKGGTITYTYKTGCTLAYPYAGIGFNWQTPNAPSPNAYRGDGVKIYYKLEAAANNGELWMKFVTCDTLSCSSGGSSMTGYGDFYVQLKAENHLTDGFEVFWKDFKQPDWAPTKLDSISVAARGFTGFIFELNELGGYVENGEPIPPDTTKSIKFTLRKIEFLY